jgi:hypothetical protein
MYFITKKAHKSTDLWASDQKNSKRTKLLLRAIRKGLLHKAGNHIYPRAADAYNFY